MTRNELYTQASECLDAALRTMPHSPMRNYHHFRALAINERLMADSNRSDGWLASAAECEARAAAHDACAALVLARMRPAINQIAAE